MTDPLELLEVCAIVPTFCDGLAAVEIDRNGIARLQLYAEQRDTDGRMSHVLTARIIMPRAGLIEAAERLLAASSSEAGDVSPAWLHGAAKGCA